MTGQDGINITGKVEESRLLQREMRVDLVQQLMRKIRFLATAPPAPGTDTDTDTATETTGG